jgi:hypothetical protein
MNNGPIIDERNYSVVGINGFRQGGLTIDQAATLACRLQDQMDQNGWRGKMQVFYRDGSEVDWKRLKGRL